MKRILVSLLIGVFSFSVAYSAAKGPAKSVKIQNYLKSNPRQKFDVVTISDALEESGKAETVYKLLQHLAANRRVLKFPGKDQFSSFFQACI